MGCSLGISAQMARALSQLPSPDDVAEVREILLEIAHMGLHDEHDLELPTVRIEDVAMWSEGGEQFRKMSRDALIRLSGYPGGIGDAPLLADFIDPYRRLHQGTPEFADAQASGLLEPVSLRWHQWVALLSGVTNFLEGKPFFVMDSVGLGKTFEALAMIAYIEWAREVYENAHQWPGAFGESRELMTRVAGH